MTKIKLCGLSRMEDIETVNAIKPDFIGFVFAERSKRRVSPLKATELKSKLDPDIKAVGVFLNDDLDMVAAMLNLGIVDLVQLHGAEDEDYLQKLRKITDKPIIKAFIIRSPEDVERAESSTADYILLDTFKKGMAGGTGETFRWREAAEDIRRLKKPLLLAGGISAENAGEAARTLSPFALDVSGSLEENGEKSPEKIKAFMRTIEDIRNEAVQ